MTVTDLARRSLFRLLRTGFRLTPMPARTRDRLRQRFLERHADLIPQGPRGQFSAGAGQPHRAWRHVGGPAIGHVPYRAGTLPTSLPARLVAFYLPQFHPIPENDAWWGKGFTEWTNVTRALPQFEGHSQPRLPGELGFYDLRHAEVMRRQMQLAREYGISAFCTYFYWFAGKTLLETPLQTWLDDASLDLPICLCWANENWSRRWDGRAEHILIGQEHSAEDDIAFINYVSRYLGDSRYLRVDGKPVLMVYRPGLLPDARATAQRWREWCRTHGLGEIHLAYVQSFDRVDPRDIGFDAAVEFPPNNTTLPPITGEQQLINPAFHGEALDWRTLAGQARQSPDPAYRLYPGVNPGWDNEARRSGRGRIYLHASPRGYRDWLRTAIETAKRRAPDAPMVFINAWNEWAEGAVLEPDARLGHAWLEATRAALQPAAARSPHALGVIIHAWQADELCDMAKALHDSGVQARIVITTSAANEKAMREAIAGVALTAEIEIFEERGRDVLPFLHIANRLLNDGVDLVLKLRTTQSTHGPNGDGTSALLSAAGVKGALDAFRQQSTLGLLLANETTRAREHTSNTQLPYLRRRMGIDPSCQPEAQDLSSGTFWARMEALRPLLDAHLDPWEFDDESQQGIDTMANAIEQCLPLVVASIGQLTKKVSDVPGLSR